VPINEVVLWMGARSLLNATPAARRNERVKDALGVNFGGPHKESKWIPVNR